MSRLRGPGVRVPGALVVLFGAPQMDQFNSAFGQITTQAIYTRQMRLVLRAGF